MSIHSKLVQEHLQKEIISSQYLIDAPFTLQDLQDIAESKASDNKSLRVWRPHYASKPKLVNSGTSYAKYLEKAGIEQKKSPYYY